uniref:C2H2-type domain-containing protein n=1 Tax=Oryzias sinensis TaxID=183150 RepID=A0A8C8DTL3_9TELE
MTETCSFQNQLLSVMEVLAKAAVAEIDRRVDDCCAVLRLEVSQSRRDIELLKTKCEGMEAELRRSRMRARRKAWSAPAEERLSASVTEVSRTERREEAESQNHLHQCAHLEEPANESERVQVKEEHAWRLEDEQTSGSEQLSCCIAAHVAQTEGRPGSFPSPERLPDSESSAGLGTFPDQQPHSHHDQAEVIMKQEKVEEREEGGAPFGPACSFVRVEAEADLWPADLCRDAGLSFSGQHIEQIPNTFAPQSSFRVEKIHSAEKSHAVLLSAARVKRRARTFGYRRPPLEEAHGVSGKYSMDAGPTPHPSEHSYRDNPAVAAPSPSGSHCSRSSFSLVRRMRTPWRPGVGEKRFSCTYCDKGFTRFSQLKEHLRCHTGEKPFSCTQCGRSFTKQCNLIRHAVVHSGEKPYQCSLCGKCFTQRSSLKSHQKTVH